MRGGRSSFPLAFLSAVGRIYCGPRTSIFIRVRVRQRVSTRTESTRGQCDCSSRYRCARPLRSVRQLSTLIACRMGPAVLRVLLDPATPAGPCPCPLVLTLSIPMSRSEEVHFNPNSDTSGKVVKGPHRTCWRYIFYVFTLDVFVVVLLLYPGFIATRKRTDCSSRSR